MTSASVYTGLAWQKNGRPAVLAVELVVRYREPLSIGLDRRNGLWLYTSRGTGFWGPPQRSGVPPEITRLRLVTSSRRPEAPTLRQSEDRSYGSVG